MMRQICLWTKCVPASKQDLKRALMKESQQLAPEGIAGIFAARANFRSDIQSLDIHSRKGFCKLALETGVSLVPVYCFGSSDSFNLAGGSGSVLATISRQLRVSITHSFSASSDCRFHILSTSRLFTARFARSHAP